MFSFLFRILHAKKVISGKRIGDYTARMFSNNVEWSDSSFIHNKKGVSLVFFRSDKQPYMIHFILDCKAADVKEQMY